MAKADKGDLTVDAALKMYEDYKSYWSENYDEARIDINFSLGKGQWEDADVNARKAAGKVSLVINQLPQFIHQVTNDIRQNTPSIHVIPDTDGDLGTAEMFSDLIRSIEYRSSADEVYDTAAEYAVKCGIGFIRVDHDYCEDSEEQELLLRRVPDPLSVWIDPASVECDGRDSDGAICLEQISKKQFEQLYPGKDFTCFADPKGKKPEDTIFIAEIFVREHTWEGGRKTATIVKRYKFSGADLLAKTTFPGKYVPIVPVFGEEIWVDGKRILSSLIRQARDPQRRLNHWASKEAEILAMAPIAPVMAEEGTLVNERNQWQSPGSEMVLEYRKVDLNGDPANKPERLQPPPIPTGIINAMQGAKENIKESMGLYNASIGQRSNETSGVAITARQQEGDVATFHFADNLRRSVNQCGRVVVGAVPVIYDTPRVLQTIDNENKPKSVGVNGAEPQEGQEQHYDLTQGKYHVRVTTGASYTTRRQETTAVLQELFSRAPELMTVMGDIYFANSDFSGAEAMAERMKKVIQAQNPNLIEDKENPEDPRVAQMGQMLQQAQQALQQLATENEQLKIEQQNKTAENALKHQELEIKGAEIVAKRQEAGLKYNYEQEKLKSDLVHKRMDTKAAVSPDVALMDSDLNEGASPVVQLIEQIGVALAQQSQSLNVGLQTIAATQAESAQVIAQSNQILASAINQPKQVIYDEAGNIAGVQ